jgi:hypothetical protein
MKQDARDIARAIYELSGSSRPTEIMSHNPPAADIEWYDEQAVRVSTEKIGLYTFDKETGVLTAVNNGALVLDGGSPIAADTVLLLDSHVRDPLDAGIYTVTQVGDAGNPFILTRHSDYTKAKDYFRTLSVQITAGSTKAGKFYEMPVPPKVLDRENSTKSYHVKFRESSTGKLFTFYVGSDGIVEVEDRRGNIHKRPVVKGGYHPTPVRKIISLNTTVTYIEIYGESRDVFEVIGTKTL